MRKNRIWTYEKKLIIINERLSGATLRELCDKYNIKSDGMIANWVRNYKNGTLSVHQQGRPKDTVDELDILKKCFAQLTKIRTK